MPPLRLEILDHVRLIENHVVTALSPEDLGVGECEGVRCDADVERVFSVPSDSALLALLRVAIVCEDLETR